jgi:hypothetical protein
VHWIRRWNSRKNSRVGVGYRSDLYFLGHCHGVYK